MELREVVRARGHEHVSAAHTGTLEITSDDFLTPAGDCILGIDADRVPADFDAAFVAACQDAAATITATIEVGDSEVRIPGRGDPTLTFESDRSHVCRTSEHVDDRTVMVEADAAAADVDRDVVAALAEGVPLTVTISVA
jgi:hypothetical protein